MQLTYQQYDLKLKYPFRIARSVEAVTPVVLSEFAHEGIAGFGEASPSCRYGETIETVKSFLAHIDLERFENPFAMENISNYLESIAPENTAAKAAVDIALHDWVGKKLGVPLYKIWGLDKTKTPVTSFTIGIDTRR